MSKMLLVTLSSGTQYIVQQIIDAIKQQTTMY